MGVNMLEEQNVSIVGKEGSASYPVLMLQGAAAAFRNMTDAQYEWSQKWLSLYSEWDKEGGGEVDAEHGG